MENECFFSILIYIFIPLIILWYYVRLVDKMKAEMVESPPIFSLFLVLISYTIIPIVTTFPILYDIMPVNESLIFYSYIAAPVVMIFVAAVNHGKRYFSRYHSGVYKASLIYLLIAPASVVVWVSLILGWGKSIF
ncbi:hypothetical protein [Dysgonomonas sp.]